MNKQLLMDFLVVLVAPVCFVAAYHLLLGNEITTDEMLAVTSSGEVAEPGAISAELGAKSKEILTELKSIRFDESVFSDPAYLSLQDFTPEYATTSIGRDYPFSIPTPVADVLSEGLRAKAEKNGSILPPARTTKPVTPPASR